MKEFMEESGNVSGNVGCGVTGCESNIDGGCDLLVIESEDEHQCTLVISSDFDNNLPHCNEKTLKSAGITIRKNISKVIGATIALFGAGVATSAEMIGADNIGNAGVAASLIGGLALLVSGATIVAKDKDKTKLAGSTTAILDVAKSMQQACADSTKDGKGTQSPVTIVRVK